MAELDFLSVVLQSMDPVLTVALLGAFWRLDRRLLVIETVLEKEKDHE